MTSEASDLPIKGIVGVVAGEASLEAALRPREGEAARPDALEVRADLFEPPAAALAAVEQAAGELPVLFTVRLRSHGGKWERDDAARIGLYRDALRRGASLVDAEWNSEAARALAREGAPLVASHHDFESMPDADSLEEIARLVAELHPRVLKVVPTARNPRDAVRILEWVAAARPDGPPRVGFAMGEMGLPSRVLAMAWGSPFTYGSLGKAVAPGQPSVRDLRALYRADRLTRSTRVLGVIGNPVAHSLSPEMHNRALGARGIDAVYIPFRLESVADLEGLVDSLGIDGLSVTIPFKEDALHFASEADDRARSSGAANTLLIRRESGGVRRALATNTDFDGVLGPLERRRVETRGLSAAIIGNGGAARGAARALKEAGSSVTLYSRSIERGRPVAEALGVLSAPLGTLEEGRHGLIVNATPLGLRPGDPSPVPAEVFNPRTIAFDMIYEPPETPFLTAARSRGAPWIPGREMLLCQGLVQFRLFTGAEASYEELEAAFLDGQAARRP
ncbi:MAG TPA: type I 3-dehydroquinate dehydratase [Planctomycetota bacterium]|nr:type I 3-dehydroquinate dehydratase [Planctomycetota bacterium]